LLAIVQIYELKKLLMNSGLTDPNFSAFSPAFEPFISIPQGAFLESQRSYAVFVILTLRFLSGLSDPILFQKDMV
jgi:hypothetical protein